MVPIVIFAFNRPQSLQRLVDSLMVSPLFDASDKFVFVDGPRNEQDRPLVEQTVEIARAVTQNVTVSATNKGLGASIISGVTEIVNRYGAVIVLEDDLWCAPGFLSFMNEALAKYKEVRRICAVCGYGLKIKRPAGDEEDVYLAVRSSSWGWGTWKDRWNLVDWEVTDYGQFIADKGKRRAFNRGGSDMTSMLRAYMEGRNRSWAIRFCYWQWKNGLYSLHPFKSLVDNEGYGDNATNCRQKYSRFKTDMNLSTEYALSLPEALQANEKILRRLAWYHSIPLRAYSRLRRLIKI